MKPIRNNQILRTGLICFLLFSVSYLFATEYDVAGRVINTQKDPIKNAVVTLSDLPKRMFRLQLLFAMRTVILISPMYLKVNTLLLFGKKILAEQKSKNLRFTATVRW